MYGRYFIRLLLALTILVSVFLRPPGTMLVFNGETITYELCSGGEGETVTVALGGDTQEQIDLGCDFFAAQIGDLPNAAPIVPLADAEVVRDASLPAVHLHVWQTTRTSNAPRAPPFVS